MAQPGDTITYTFSGEREDEDISDVDQIEIEYIDGAGGEDGEDISGGFGGRVEDVVADVSDFNDLYIWVAEVDIFGRYNGGGAGNTGSGSSEVSLLDTDFDDSDIEPFIAGSGGGAGGYDEGGPFDQDRRGSGGARGGTGSDDALGEPPPAGGDGPTSLDDPRGDGDSAVDGHAGTQATIIDSGTTIEGGGSGPDEDGEIRIAYKEGQEPPERPENLTAELL